MLKTKSITAPKDASDGLRISVMSRHTLNDGVTPDPRITAESYDLWLPTIAPPGRLLWEYYKIGLPWEQFEKRYLEHIRQPRIQLEVQILARQGLEETITLLCIEETPEHCHRRLLAEECKRYQPSLFLVIR